MNFCQIEHLATRLAVNACLKKMSQLQLGCCGSDAVKLAGNADLHILSWMRPNFGQIRPLTTDLAALERFKINVSACSVAINPILFELACNMHNSLDEFPTTASGVSCP